MSRFVAATFSSIRRTSASKFRSFAREWRFSSWSFSSSSTIGFSKGKGGIFTGLVDRHRVVFLQERRDFTQVFRRQEVAAAWRFEHQRRWAIRRRVVAVETVARGRDHNPEISGGEFLLREAHPLPIHPGNSVVHLPHHL